MLPSNVSSALPSDFKVRANDSLIALCSDGPKGILTWISWFAYETKIQPFIEKTNSFNESTAAHQLITKNTTVVYYILKHTFKLTMYILFVAH